MSLIEFDAVIYMTSLFGQLMLGIYLGVMYKNAKENANLKVLNAVMFTIILMVINIAVHSTILRINNYGEAVKVLSNKLFVLRGSISLLCLFLMVFWVSARQLSYNKEQEKK